jgi:hypothetical protein
MGKGFPLPLRGLTAAGLLPAFFSIWVFQGAYRADRERVRELASVSWSHLNYAWELHDDMGMIDWARNLEKNPCILAFQAAQGRKILAQGGNPDLFPVRFPEGPSYALPATWNDRVSSSDAAGTALDFRLTCRFEPGPFAWALAFLAAGWTSGMAVWAFFRSRPEQLPPRLPEPAGFPVPRGPDKPPAERPQTPPPLSGPSLFLDLHFILRYVSPDAALKWDVPAAKLTGSHLLDLEPDPLFLQALEKGEPARVEKPFSSHPEISVLLKPGSEGWWLLLENPAGSLPPKNVDFVDFPVGKP